MIENLKLFIRSMVMNIACLMAVLLVVACSQRNGKKQTPEKDYSMTIQRNDSTSLSAELKPIEDYMKTKTGVSSLRYCITLSNAFATSS